MAQVTITINSREYAIACEDGQELRILQLSRILDEKAKLLTDGSTQVSENMLLTMIALLLADELSELQKNKPQNSDITVQNCPDLTKLDTDLADKIKSLNAAIKTLANEINLL